MKRQSLNLAMAIILAVFMSTPAFSMDEKPMSGHGMDHSGHMGALVHESTVDGFKLAYHLIDIKEKMTDMKNMPEMSATHHMMVYITPPGGHKMDMAMVGYLVENPDGTDQKLMAMGMSGGFGSDVDFSAKGVYKVKTKVVAGDKKIMDSFSHEVK